MCCPRIRWTTLWSADATRPATGLDLLKRLAAAREVLLCVGWRQAVGLGILMNTRGLSELIALNVGLDLGVISPELLR
jgi:Kef-type K+ transport system membrane component KefB